MPPETVRVPPILPVDCRPRIRLVTAGSVRSRLPISVLALVALIVTLPPRLMAVAGRKLVLRIMRAPLAVNVLSGAEAVTPSCPK